VAKGSDKGVEKSSGQPRRERRRFPRIEVQTTRVDVRTTYIYTTASVANISKKGLFIKTPHPLAPGTEVEVGLYIPNLKDPVKLKGIVRWWRKPPSGDLPPGMGVELIEISKEIAEALEYYLEHSPRNI